ncbi:MAG TPA: AMP-binding protein [Spirochaetota bacterium]|nr:AMP-binding protein [Spirochaetota bacterium]
MNTKEDTVMNSLYDFYKSSCEKYKGKLLFSTGMTYGEALKHAEARAAFLQNNGLKKGDVIALLSHNSIEFCITFMAITSLGAIVLPLDPNLDREKYQGMLKPVKCRTVFTTPEFRSCFKRVTVFSTSLSENLERKVKFRKPVINENDVSSMFYTSGTTGEPKIVQLTHANIFKTAHANAEFCRTTPNYMILCILPLFHVYGLIAAFIGPVAHGSSICIQPSLKGPDIMKSLAENPITMFPAVPLMWEMIMDGIINKVKVTSKSKYRMFRFFLMYGGLFRKSGLSFIPDKVFSQIHRAFGTEMRIMISGGAPLKKIYARYYSNMGFKLVEGYGLSESTGPICVSSEEKNAMGSIGKPLNGNSVKLADINSEGVGEICIKGDAVMPGYYNNDRLNAEIFDTEGFFHTGDLGRIDTAGNIFITGRSKNVIVLPSGKNVYPEELEGYYKESGLISEIAVFGISDKNGESVFAVIVPAIKNESSYVTIKAELERMNRGLPSYKTVNSFAISFDPLPINSTKKILYDKVRDSLKKGIYIRNENERAVLQNRLTAQNPEEEQIISLLKKKFGKKDIYARGTFADMGIDSLGMVDFIVFLEENLEITISSERMKHIQTMDELLPYITGLEKTAGTSISTRIFEGEITEKPFPIFNHLHNVFILFFKALSRIVWKFKVIDPEKLDFNGTIITPNHTSFMDIIWVSIAIPSKYRKLVYVAGNKRFSFLKYIFPMLPVIWIDEGNTIEVLKKSADILRQGMSLIIFPEGGRSADGRMVEFKTGAAYLAKNLNRKIIPLSINGAYDIWPKQNLLPRFSGGMEGSIVVGDSINPEDFKDVDSLNLYLKNSIQKNIQDINNSGCCK